MGKEAEVYSELLSEGKAKPQTPGKMKPGA
jgi:hypothetical protein